MTRLLRRAPYAAVRRSASSVVGFLGLFAALGPACETDLGERTPASSSTFGAIVFREACQRVTYSAELAAGQSVDVSGAKAFGLCSGQTAPPDASPVIKALFQERANIIAGVDTGVPVPLQEPLNTYLLALQPLQDDGTLGTLLQRTGQSLQLLAADSGAMAGLAKLSHLGGVRPPQTSGGLLRALAAVPSLDDFVGVALPLLDQGGVAAPDFQALLTATAFELRHLERSTDTPTSPERSAALLRDLLTATRPELKTGQSLLIALRDPRGLPLLDEVVAPYVKDPSTGLAVANAAGYFQDAAGRALPYVAPLPEVGVKASGSRDALGRALRTDGKPLYRYLDLDGSLLAALLVEAPRLADDSPATAGGAPRDMLLGLARGASLLAGARTMLQKTKDGETLSYAGFDRNDSVLLELAYGGTQLLRFGSAGTPPEQDLLAGLDSLKTLLGSDPNESPLARALKALLDAADEAKKPAYAAAKLPEQSPLFDDLAPIIQRLLAVDNGQLAEDLVAALQDPHAKNLGPIMAQLADERGYFFMRQPSTSDEFLNGIDPQAPGAVIGSFGNRPNRTAPDADATLDWRNLKTDDPQNNRSAVQRLMHLIADTNGKTVFCNGRNASVFGGLVLFDEACDMFRVDSVGQFFLLSIASPALRSDPATAAKQSASFLEAVKNGNDCRCAAGTGPCRDKPNQTRRCNALTTNILDGKRGDDVLAGLLGVVGFGRYPEPAAAARALFIDLWNPQTKQRPEFTPTQPADLLLNHIKNGDGSLCYNPDSTPCVDLVDPDGRKFKDANGQDRLFVDEHNGILFALEAARAPAKLPDGTANPYPNDNFYGAMRPLVDAFAKHAECVQRDGFGVCVKSQNATQLLIDALTVLHQHYPSARSQNYGRSFADSYGAMAMADGAVSYEPLLTKILGGDLLLATGDLAPILLSLTTDGKVGSPRALPVLIRLGRYVFDPALAPPGGLRYRDGTTVALRNDGKPAGAVTPFYLLADALKKKKALFGRPENQAAKDRWDRAISDVIDLLLKVKGTPAGMGTKYQFDNPRLRPLAQILLDFAKGRVTAHGSDLAGWTAQLNSDLTDALTGPLATGLFDLGAKLDDNAAARAQTYLLLRQTLSDQNPGARAALQVAAVDAVQLLLDDPDLVAVGRGLSSVIDPQKGPVLGGVTLMRRGRELEQASSQVAAPKQVLVRLLRSLYQLDATGVHPMFRLSDAIAEVNRAQPGLAGDYTAADYQAVLANTGKFLIDEQRGLLRFIQIVKSRCLPGATAAACPQTTP